jgi:hypothetical protein
MKPTWCTLTHPPLSSGTKNVTLGTRVWENLNVTNKQKKQTTFLHRQIIVSSKEEKSGRLNLIKQYL